MLVISEIEFGRWRQKYDFPQEIDQLHTIKEMTVPM